MTTAAKVAVHTIALSATHGDWLTMDYDGDNYRGAYYRRRRPYADDQAGPDVPYMRLVRLAPQGTPIEEKSRYLRFAAAAPKLGDLLQILFGEADAPHDPQATELYIRATVWGEKLP